jgi:hypothetical protein
LRTLHSISTQYENGPSNGAALHTIFAAADLLQTKACAVISPESTTIEPVWIARCSTRTGIWSCRFIAAINLTAC